MGLKSTIWLLTIIILVVYNGLNYYKALERNLEREECAKIFKQDLQQIILVKFFLNLLKKRGKIANPEREFEINWVEYSGDEGGIICRLSCKNNNPEDEDKEDYVVSITHLKIDPNHPSSDEIATYQRERNRKLMLQNRGSAMTELMPLKTSKKTPY